MSEGSTTGFTPCPPSNSYRESIGRVAWPERRIVSTLSSRSSQSGSNCSSYSGASSSYMSKISGSSSGAVWDFGANELTRIAHRMLTDGYIQHIVQAFGDGGSRDRALENWFVELDMDWVFQGREGNALQQQQQQHKLQDKSAWWLRELVHRWIRAFTIIVVSIKELIAGVHDTLAAARFGKASISAMLVVVAPILDILKVENLQAVLHMYICVSSASHDLRAMQVVSSESQHIFEEIGASLKTEENRLTQAVSSRMWNMRTLIDGDDSWARDILEGGGKVHRKIQMLVEWVLLMNKAHASTLNSAQSHNTENLRRLIDEMIGYTKDLIRTKSKLCGDPSLSQVAIQLS